jgi:hypothetical protein
VADRKAIITKIHADGSFDLIHYGPTLLEHIPEKHLSPGPGQPGIEVGEEVTLAYCNGEFVVLQKPA